MSDLTHMDPSGDEGAEATIADAILVAKSADDVLARRAESLATETIEEEADDRVSILVFRLGDERYAVRVDDVREIFQEYRITQIPCVPDFVLGVVNVRGEIVSVCDPARLMGVGSVELSAELPPQAIVLQGHDAVTAIVVDEIADIAEIPQAAIEPPVSTIDRTQAEFVSGSAFVDGTMLGLIHTERILRPVSTGRAS